VTTGTCTSGGQLRPVVRRPQPSFARQLQRLWLLAAPAIVALAGCVGERDWPRARPIQAQQLPAERALSPAPVDPAAWPAESWWQVYGDEQLNALVGEALAGSPSLQSAEARLQAAQAEVTRAGGALLPSTSLDAQLTRQRFSRNDLYPAPIGGSYVTEGRIALDLTYDIDFWGRNRALLAAAQANVRAVAADQAAARLALTVALLRAYVQLNLQFTFQQIAVRSLAQQTQILDLTRQRAAKGLDNIARVRQAEATVALTRASVTFVDASLRLLRAQIGDLVGSGPDRGADLQQPKLLLASDRWALPTRLPAELLGRRPDIEAQRWRVEAAARNVAASEAAFYPNVNLTAFAGFQSIGVSSLLQGSSALLGVGPALSLPLFNRRALRGELQAGEAQYDLSVAQYNQTVIDAVNDVAGVVTNWQAADREAVDARAAQEAAQSAFTVSKDRYRAGLDNYLDVLSSENELLLTQALDAQIVSRELNASVDLIRALGGGYLPGRPD
jgi:NodT family efflux transporter outer membrane factor (OMF) lipoprotein